MTNDSSRNFSKIMELQIKLHSQKKGFMNIEDYKKNQRRKTKQIEICQSKEKHKAIRY